LFFVLDQERFVRAETAAAFGGAEQSEEVRGAVAESNQDAVEFLRAELFAVRQAGYVARQFFELVGGDAGSEVLAGYVFDVMRFVEDHGAVIGDDAAS